jgi:hypothetical protein
MEIDVVSEAAEGLAGLRGGTDREGVAEVDLADSDARLSEPGEGLLWALVFDGQVAAVVVDAKVLIEAEVSRTVRPEVLKEGHAFRGVLQMAQGLRFEAQVKVLPGLPGEPFEEFDAAPEVLSGGLEFSLGSTEGLEGNRRRCGG